MGVGKGNQSPGDEAACEQVFPVVGVGGGQPAPSAQPALALSSVWPVGTYSGLTVDPSLNLLPPFLVWKVGLTKPGSQVVVRRLPGADWYRGDLSEQPSVSVCAPTAQPVGMAGKRRAGQGKADKGPTSRGPEETTTWYPGVGVRFGREDTPCSQIRCRGVSLGRNRMSVSLLQWGGGAGTSGKGTGRSKGVLGRLGASRLCTEPFHTAATGRGRDQRLD